MWKRSSRGKWKLKTRARRDLKKTRRDLKRRAGTRRDLRTRRGHMTRGHLQGRGKLKWRRDKRWRNFFLELSLSFLLLIGVQMFIDNIHGEGVHVLHCLHLIGHPLVSMKQHQI
jgi:type VI protein secretion system component VasF